MPVTPAVVTMLCMHCTSVRLSHAQMHWTLRAAAACTGRPCAECVSKQASESQTHRSQTASACARRRGSVVRIRALMRTQYFEIRTTLAAARCIAAVAAAVAIVLTVGLYTHTHTHTHTHTQACIVINCVTVSTLGVVGVEDCATLSAVYLPQGSRTSQNTAESSVSGALEPKPEVEIWRRPVFPTQRPRLSI